MNELVSSRAEKDVAVVTINNPPVNALSPGVPEGIEAAVQSAAVDPDVKAIILMGDGATFIAGADIKELQKLAMGQPTELKGLNSLLGTLENCAKPIICAIHGTALGGGLEVASACHYRVALESAKVGQPEVKLGIIPGAHGTQRLPRLAGVAKAAELCATGKLIGATEAKRLGILDEVFKDDLLGNALNYARAVAAQAPRKTSAINDRLGNPDENAAALTALRKAVAAKARGARASLKAIDAVELAATLPFEEGCEREREIFEECIRADESRGLMHVFFGERTVAKIPGISKETPQKPIRKAAVIGAGTMGGGIAMTYLNAGIPVALKEVDQERLDKGMETIRRNYDATVRKGRLTAEQLQKRLGLLQPTVNYDDIRDADIVVEAVFENMDLKKKVFAEIDAVAAPGAILASNTSTLDIDEIASATQRPDHVIGHHFFSPANIMRLLEIVRGKATCDEVIGTSMALAKKLGKVGVLVGNCHGFVGNRMFGPYIREAQYLAEEGASIVEIDQALVDFGMAMGIFAVEDLAGIDVGWRIRKESPNWLPEGYRQYRAADRLAEMGRFGQKTGAGWYRYEKGSRQPIPDPEVEKIIAECAAEGGIERRTVEPSEVIERMVYALINEGAKILEDGIALRPVDIDIIYVYGYGFPPHRGGPMFYADTVGVSRVYERVCQFEKEHGVWWKPSALLKRLAEEGKGFRDYQLTI